MFISILSVDVTTRQGPKSSYQQAEVAYRDGEGKVGSKKVMSFDKSGVFEVISNAKQGETYDIGLTKGEKYWEWTSAKKAAAPANGQSGNASRGAETAAPSATNSRGFETPEERAKKQIYIVRQSSLSAAVATLTVGRKSEVKPEEVIELAKQYEAFVFDTGRAQEVAKQDVGTIESIEEDLPF